MSLLAAYATLEALGPVVTTAEAAAALRRDASSASRLLRSLQAAGRAHRIRQGVWAIGATVPDPFTLVGEITRPFPAYVSFLSALNSHGLIDQIPRAIEVASLDRAHRVESSYGSFDIHHLPGELLGGWAPTRRGPVAEPAKAIFDLAYVGAASRGRAPLVPELELPAHFEPADIEAWVSRIRYRRLASLTRSGVDQIMSRAVR
jgi:predicted transcriptional regulator of viral defense system